MLNIYLVRHGQDEDNASFILNGRRDTDLTHLGILQANSLSKKIKKMNIKLDIIFTSPLKRAHKTAKIIQKVINCKCLKKMNDLIEREFGEMTGKPYSQIENLCGDNIIETNSVAYFLSPCGSETFPNLLERAKKLLLYLTKKYKNANILLVSHGDFGKMIYCAYYNLDWKNVLEMFHFGNSDLLLMSPASPSIQPHVFREKQYNL